MSSDDRIARAANLLFAEIDGEAVALSAENGVCYGLNHVGLRVLQLIEPPASFAEVCARLVNEFDVDPDTCEREVTALISELADEGLVVVGRPGQTP